MTSRLCHHIHRTTTWFLEKTRPVSTGPKPTTRDFNLEGLRGFFALVVFFDHALQNHRSLGAPEYHLFLINSGPSAVLGFFALSGYVIGLTNTRLFSAANATDYLKRRAVRLLPIYLVAMAGGILAGHALGHAADWRVILGHLFFLQDVFVEPMDGNGPLWSLSYEAFYYLFFLLIWWVRPVRALLIVTVALFIACAAAGLAPRAMVSLFVGFSFWIAGLLLAWTPPTNARPVSPWGVLLLIGVIHNLQPGAMLFRKLEILGYLHDGHRIPVTEIVQLLPAIILLIGSVTGRLSARLSISLAALVWLTASAGVLQTWRVVGLEQTHILAWALACVLSLPLMWPTETGRRLLAGLAPLGEISYAAYVMHIPVIVAVGVLLPVTSPFPLKLSAAALITLLVSHMLEKWTQPRLSRLLRPPAPALPLPR